MTIEELREADAHIGKLRAQAKRDAELIEELANAAITFKEIYAYENEDYEAVSSALTKYQAWKEERDA